MNNQGSDAARNLGMTMATGKYIAVMDSDDIAIVNRLELQYSYLELNSSVGYLGGCMEIIDDHNNVLGLIKVPLSYSKLKIWLLKNNYVPHPTVMIKSELVKKYHLFYNKRYRYASDYDLVLRASKIFPIVNMKQILIQYRSHPSQISSAKRIEQKAAADEVRKKQLKSFEVTFTEQEIALYLKIMGNEYIKDSEIPMCENWLHKLCKANNKRRLYDKDQFNKLSQRLFASICENGFGGWSIENELLNWIHR